MKKMIVILGLILSSVTFFAIYPYDNKTNFDTFEQVGKELKRQVESERLNWYTNEYTCTLDDGGANYVDKGKYLILDAACVMTDEEDLGNYSYVYIYGQDKVTSMRNKLENGQKVFKFPSLYWATKGNMFIYYKK